jgi:ubiquinone/menaquinone biosynthesis C-methylase UbiE
MAHPAIANQIGDLFAREEEGREPPYGTALDLGCGSGIWAVELARRGWRVTGVDFAPKALRRARDRAKQSDVELRLFQGDMTDLRSTDPRFRIPASTRLRLFSRRALRRPAQGRRA